MKRMPPAATPERSPRSREQPQAETRGQRVFMGTTCVMCHTIGGTLARGAVGPELTHIAGRKMLGANLIPNTRGNLGGWVVDPQSIKPGVRMPQNQIGPDDLRDLLTYLESLK